MAGEGNTSTASLPYCEPDITTILVLASFLLLLNIANVALDWLLCCGLLGQILIGVAWGSPGAQWLTASDEATIVHLGYLGLILLVYQGGLHTSFQSLKANILLSLGVAVTGIVLPIALSYSLQGLLDATPLQAFAAGAALCSTSLGTTFTVLDASGLSTSRLGIVLTSAAMMDDVVGLVMVQVISALGQDHFSWVVVVRPVLVSVAFAIVVPLVCVFVVKPMTIWINSHRKASSVTSIDIILQKAQTAFTIHTLFLIGLVVSGDYAGTSNLFTAYIAGAAISWWDSEVPHPTVDKHLPSVSMSMESTTRNSNVAPGASFEICNIVKILQPFFFASIGFSIPISHLFRGSTAWRGIVYAALMAFAKLACGLWLLRLSLASRLSQMWENTGQGQRPIRKDTSNSDAAGVNTVPVESNRLPDPAKPLSLYPSLILALAMCARGEIGFLISGVAESSGVYSRSKIDPAEPSEMFLVVSWAIMLCTIVGPLGVGLCVRRVKRLEENKNEQQEGSGRDVLGVWGID